MLQISIYYSASYNQRTEIEGDHGRLAHHGGTFHAEQILAAEITGDYDRYVDGEKQRWTGEERGEILVAGTLNQIFSNFKTYPLILTVSAHTQLRDDMRTLVKENLSRRVRLLELEYQP